MNMPAFTFSSEKSRASTTGTDRAPRESLERCRNCGSTRLFRDEATADLVCQECGLVNREGEAVVQEPLGHSDDASRYGPGTHGRATTVLLPDKGLRTRIGPLTRNSVPSPLSHRRKMEFARLRLVDRRQGRGDSGERNLETALPQLKRLTEALGLPRTVEETAVRLYRESLARRGMRGLRIASLVAACVYVACRVHGIPRTLRVVASQSEAPRSVIATVSIHLIRDLRVKVRPVNPMDLLPKLAEDLEFPRELRSRIREYLERLDKGGYQSSGVMPATLLGTVAYVAAQEGGWRYSQDRIAKALGVTSVSLRNRVPSVVSFLRIPPPGARPGSKSASSGPGGSTSPVAGNSDLSEPVAVHG
jgi:transcription initiation factor TFIIB